jgi:hypothetical protein
MNIHRKNIKPEKPKTRSIPERLGTYDDIIALALGEHHA